MTLKSACLVSSIHECANVPSSILGHQCTSLLKTAVHALLADGHSHGMAVMIVFIRETVAVRL